MKNLAESGEPSLEEEVQADSNLYDETVVAGRIKITVHRAIDLEKKGYIIIIASLYNIIVIIILL